MSPQILETIAAVRTAVREAKGRGASIGVVPTMGALHEGHAELIRRARAANDYVVVTVFVNPIQFDRKEDLDRYPRDLATDVALCGTAGANAVFAPSVGEMYPDELLTSVDVSGGHQPARRRVPTRALQRCRDRRSQAAEHRRCGSGVLRRKGRPAVGRDSEDGCRSEHAGGDCRGSNGAGERRPRNEFAQSLIAPGGQGHRTGALSGVVTREREAPSRGHSGGRTNCGVGTSQ